MKQQVSCFGKRVGKPSWCKVPASNTNLTSVDLYMYLRWPWLGSPSFFCQHTICDQEENFPFYFSCPRFDKRNLDLVALFRWKKGKILFPTAFSEVSVLCFFCSFTDYLTKSQMLPDVSEEMTFQQREIRKMCWIQRSSKFMSVENDVVWST